MYKPVNALFLLSVGLSVATLTACTPDIPPRTAWREEMAIIVLPFANNVDAEFDRQLVSLFAKHLQVKIRFLPLPLEQAVPALLEHKAHFVAAGQRRDNNGKLLYGPTYQTVSELVVCKAFSPRRMEDLLDRTIATTAGSAQEAALLEVQQEHPSLKWKTRTQQTADDLLAEVANGDLECTVANEDQLALARNYHPDLKSSFNLATPSRLAWVFAQDSDEELIDEAQKFFAVINQDGTLRHLLDRYYGHNERLAPTDAVAFITKTRTVLPHFRQLFEEAATLTGIDWRLLAAVAYQESHWDPLATSRTNVRGMMMLTEDTADRMNVTNRLDARQSIMAGARYLQLLKEQLPLRIDEPDRTWLALAAYNQGSGHLEDARILAKQAGLNPDVWADVKKVMPLLADPLYAAQTKYGSARGGEAVIFVETVRLHHDILKHLNAREVPRMGLKPFSSLGGN